MITKAIRYRDRLDADIARLLDGRYRDLVEAEPENVTTRIDNLHTPLAEAVRRLKRQTRKDTHDRR